MPYPSGITTRSRLGWFISCSSVADRVACIIAGTLDLMLQLRLISPPECTDATVRLLVEDDGVVSVEVRRGAAAKPEGSDVVVADVLREHANDLIDAIRGLHVDAAGELSVIDIQATRSEPARRASLALRGRASDVVVWSILESRVHQDGVPSIAFFCFMAIAALIATIGIIVDSSVLIVGAMVVGPEYGPLAALAVATYQGKYRAGRIALVVLVAGLGVAVATSTVSTLVFEALGANIIPPGTRFFTRFVTEPNAYSAVVAFAAGMVGVMAVGLGRSGALTGVVVSATTIPAAAAIGVNAAAADWDEALRGGVQLGINVVCLTAGSLAALIAYRVVTNVLRR
jgi:uncharacterized hydrophobic protein (TIGR00271 family)